MIQAPRPVLAAVDGWPITTANLEAAIQTIISAAAAARPFSVFTINLDHLVKLRQSAAFRDAYNSADMVTADGAPVARLARRQNASVERTTGSDMLLPLTEAAARAGLPIFLFGSAPETLTKSEALLKTIAGGAVRIAGASAPSNNFDPASAEADAALDAIAASGARICFVALGAPKQELFALRAKERGLPCVMVCNGASLDFLVGAQRRAPKWMRRVGLEWTWRLLSSPRRLAKRYLDCALVLADIALIGPMRGRRANVPVGH